MRDKFFTLATALVTTMAASSIAFAQAEKAPAEEAPAEKAPAEEAPAEKYDTSRPAEVLKFDYKAGTSYLQKMEMEQNSQIAMGENKIDQKMNMTMDISMEVTPVEGSTNKRVQMSYERMVMDMNAGGMAMKYDSENPDPNSPLGQGVGGIIGQSFAVIVDENNEVQEVEGIDKLTEGAAANPLIKQYLNEDAIAQMMNTWITQGFKDEPVKAGDVWDVEMEMDMSGMGKVTYKGEYTHLGHTEFKGHEVAVIGIDAEMDLNFDFAAAAKDNPQMQMMQALGMEMNGGGQKGKMFWDNKLQYLRGMETEQTMSMSLTNPQDGSKMDIPMNQKISLTIETK